jgi:hypothetical protein
LAIILWGGLTWPEKGFLQYHADYAEENCPARGNLFGFSPDAAG